MHVDGSGQRTDKVSFVGVWNLEPGLLARLGELLEQGFRQTGTRGINRIDLHGSVGLAHRGFRVIDWCVTVWEAHLGHVGKGGHLPCPGVMKTRSSFQAKQVLREVHGAGIAHGHVLCLAGGDVAEVGSIMDGIAKERLGAVIRHNIVRAGGALIVSPQHVEEGGEEVHLAALPGPIQPQGVESGAGVGPAQKCSG